MRLTEISDPDYKPHIERPRIPLGLSWFPVTRQMHARLYRGRLEDYEIFRRAVISAIRPDSVVLDVGAGRGARPAALSLKGKVARAIGVDVDEAVKQNPGLDEAHVCSIEDMPFIRTGSVDFAVARYVVEHLPDPLRALREVRRVLKKGGQFIFLTPNRRHYVASVAARLGTPLHKMLNAARGVEAQDVFPTMYRLNTPESIRATANLAGFSSAEISLFEAQPNYLTLHPVLFAAGAVYERAVNRFLLLESFRCSILGRLTA